MTPISSFFLSPLLLLRQGAHRWQEGGARACLGPRALAKGHDPIGGGLRWPVHAWQPAAVARSPMELARNRSPSRPGHASSRR